MGLAAATLASVLLFRDPLTLVQLVGMAVLAAGVLVLQTGPRRS